MIQGILIGAVLATASLAALNRKKIKYVTPFVKWVLGSK